MKISYLDLSTHTGWANGDSAGEPEFGTQHMPSTGDDVGRFAKAYNDWVFPHLEAYEPEIVVYEAPILHKGKTSIATARKLMGLAWHTEFVCKFLGIECREANLMTVKLFFAGHGHADKDMMIRVAQRYGWAVLDDNAADACGGWAYSAFKLDPAGAARFGMGPLGAKPK